MNDPAGTHRRYPTIRPTSGYTDPRVRSTGPGRHSAERDPGLTARLVLVLTVLVGQLWALAVGLNAWMRGREGVAWWCAAFEVASFAVALVLWRTGNPPRAGSPSRAGNSPHAGNPPHAGSPRHAGNPPRAAKPPSAGNPPGSGDGRR